MTKADANANVSVELLDADFGPNGVQVELKITGYIEDDDGARHFVYEDGYTIEIPITEVD